MWLQTPRGFFSAVQHRDDPDLLVVRTRVHADAQTLLAYYQEWVQIPPLAPDGLLPEPAITTYEFSDYPWRVILPRGAWIDFLYEEAKATTYGNFKDEVKRTQGPQRAEVYSRVWAVLHTLEDTDPDRRAPIWEWPEDLGDECVHGVSWADPCREC